MIRNLGKPVADDSIRIRLRKVAIIIGIACLLGGGYAILCIHGIMIPCVFNYFTGLKCPGCGVTHMCVSLLHFEFSDAFAANQALFILMPVFVFFFARLLIRYIRTGRAGLTKAENIMCVVIVAMLVLFAIFRNIFHF